jgi:hypothetical protein
VPQAGDAGVVLAEIKIVWGGNVGFPKRLDRKGGSRPMNSVIYLIGLVVVVLAVLSFLGLH